MQAAPKDCGLDISGEIFEGLSSVRRRTSVPRSTIYDWIGKGLFPRPVRIGPRRVAWRASDIDRWMANAVASGEARQSK